VCENFLLPEMKFSIYAWFGKFGPRYSTDWGQGGPIIERAQIAVDFDASVEAGGPCAASIADLGWYITGPTPLIAAMRCYVASKLGDTAKVPEELL
jgi:Protein of unknown function (DUF2591)